MKQIKYHLEYRPVLSYTIIDVPDVPIVYEILPILLSSNEIDKINAYISAINEELNKNLTDSLVISSKILKNERPRTFI